MTATTALVDDVPRLQVVGTELALTVPAVQPMVLTGVDAAVAATAFQPVYVPGVFIN